MPQGLAMSATFFTGHLADGLNKLLGEVKLLLLGWTTNQAVSFSRLLLFFFERSLLNSGNIILFNSLELH